MCGLLPPSAPKHRKIKWNIIMKSDGAGDFPVCSQTDFLPFSSSALQSRLTDKKKGQETGGWKEERDLGIESSLVLRDLLPETSVFPAPQQPLLLGSQLPPGRFAWIQLSL